MNKNPEKICIICHKPFIPDSRVGDRQKACSNWYCKQQRKKLAQKQWCLKNPDYFKERYPLLKEQILENKRKRQSQQINIPKELSGSGIQDKLNSCNNSILQTIASSISIQDELTSKISMLKKKLISTYDLVYKTS